MTNPKQKTNESFLSVLGAPAKKSIENIGIKTLEHLSTFTEKEISQLHGMGKSSMPKLRAELGKKGLAFKK